MYEVLIKLYYELDYRKFKIEDLKEIKEVLNQFKETKQEVKVRKIGTRGNNERARNTRSSRWTT